MTDVWVSALPEAAIAALGLTGHFLKKLVEMQQAGKSIDLRQWFFGYWAQTGLSVVLTVGGILVLREMGDLNMASAFLMGLSGGSGADVLGERGSAIHRKVN